MNKWKTNNFSKINGQLMNDGFYKYVMLVYKIRASTSVRWIQFQKYMKHEW